MYKIIDETGDVYTQYTYLKEIDFEKNDCSKRR